MGDKVYYVYILSNKNNTVLYIGVTGNIKRRIYQHKNDINEGFTQKYNVHKLVYIERYRDAIIAINREKQLKGWRREKKEALINNQNPLWKDLSDRF